MIKFETSIEIQSPNLKVKDIFSYQDNIISVTCVYQTLLDYFILQLQVEETAIEEAEQLVKRQNESNYASTLEQSNRRKRKSTMLTVGTVEKVV